MATRLYEELGVEPSATAEEIKKAYKKRALQTHPDRLPPTATADQKKEAEEKFRKVNHAYEVLVDAQKRKEYDIHKVWPPPDELPMPSRGSQFNRRDNTYPSPFFTHHHHDFRSFAFTDPFALFDSIFGDFGRTRSKPFEYQDPFERFTMLDRELEAEFNNLMGFGFSPFSFMGGLGGRGILPLVTGPPIFGMLPEPPRQGSSGQSHKWVSESYMTQSINGVTQTIKKQRDYEGNEHVTQTYPDGRQVYTINGVEQQPQSRLSNSREQGRISEPLQPPSTRSQRLPPPPPYSISNNQDPNNRIQPASHTGNSNYRGASHMATMASPIVSPTAYSRERDKGTKRSRHSYDSHDRDYRRSHSALQSTRRKSPNPHHHNASPYYLDDIDRNKHHTQDHWWGSRR